MGVFFHKIQAAAQGVFSYDCIGIEQEDKFARGQPNGLVVGFRKTHIAFIRNHLHFRKTRLHHLYRPISGGIVHYPYLYCQTCCCPPDGQQGLFEEEFDVVVDDDDAQSHRVRGFEGSGVRSSGVRLTLEPSNYEPPNPLFLSLIRYPGHNRPPQGKFVGVFQLTPEGYSAGDGADVHL